MITKIEKLTRFFMITVAVAIVIMVVQLMLRDGFSLEAFFYAILLAILFGWLGPKAINRDFFNGMFRDYKVPPIPYFMYLMFFFLGMVQLQ